MSKGVLSFTFVWDRECRESGTVWRPACPKWAGWIFLGIGLIMVMLGIAAIAGSLWLRELGLVLISWPILLHICILVYGLNIVAGKSGRLRSLHQGRGPNAFACPNCTQEMNAIGQPDRG